MPKLKLIMKRLYVTFIHVFGAGIDKIGVLGWLEARLDRRAFHWLRSLFAIYDVDQMIALGVPWWTYRAIDQVDAFLLERPSAKVFEFGSGASTVWLARRSGSVVSIEHDKNWFDMMQSRICGNPSISLVHIPADNALSLNRLFHSKKEGYIGQSFEKYVNAIRKTGDRYDVIVIDGRARAACLHIAKTSLADGGIIVFDNSKRSRYQTAINVSGLVACAFPGLTPSLPYPDETTLLNDGKAAGNAGTNGN
ncbi:methyltransferase family protein [Yoonia maritima]|uniref:Methyltransferase family protein n=1 Tax=Yoonia maritima TaxID=1435347 RepID=A0A2T0VZR8_9RHOB|nr:class I SAM-dependent methyltransferase [Yoonia maritima]PRY77811.1 methyltransferase family protein [Yoonia maritima]